MYSDEIKRILIVDDNREIHYDFRKILTHDPTLSQAQEAEALFFGDETHTDNPGPQFEIIDAFQGKEALEILKADLAAGQTFDMVFVDMRMPPGWDGLETIRQIREVDPAIQVVVCTAYSDHSWEDIVNDLGDENLFLLKKPFAPERAVQLAHELAAASER